MVSIISRESWGAADRRSRFTIPLPSRELWLHHSAGAYDSGVTGIWQDDVRQIQSFHQNTKGWSDIAYSFLVAPNGDIFEGRGAGVAGGHTAGRNRISHAICWIGDYHTISTPTDVQIEATAALVAYGHDQGWWPAQITGGHREAPGAATACPGDRLMGAIPEINQRAAATPTATPTTPNVSEDDDMAYLLRYIEAQYLKHSRNPSLDVHGVGYWFDRAANERPGQSWLHADCVASPALKQMVGLLEDHNR